MDRASLLCSFLLFEKSIFQHRLNVLAKLYKAAIQFLLNSRFSDADGM